MALKAAALPRAGGEPEPALCFFGIIDFLQVLPGRAACLFRRLCLLGGSWPRPAHCMHPKLPCCAAVCGARACARMWVQRSCASHGMHDCWRHDCKMLRRALPDVLHLVKRTVRKH